MVFLEDMAKIRGKLTYFMRLSPTDSRNMTTNGTQQATNAYTEGPSNQVDVIDTQAGRILCVADVRGASIEQTIAHSSA